MQSIHQHAPEILIRLRGNRTQQQVAQALGTSQQAICRYEAGIRTPDDEMKSRIAEYYGVSVTDIFYR